MKNDFFFVKSLEGDFHTKTLKGKRKVNFQSVRNILDTKTIHLNTKSFGQKSRLSTTILSANYLKTYRPQGIIFQTSLHPSYILPFDIVLLSDVKKIIVHYYRIKDNLHFYYNHQLLPGYKKFIFNNFHELVKKFPSHSVIWKDVNMFRKQAGFKRLPASKKRLIEYNEAVFEKSVKIIPIAIFGYNKEARRLAKEYKLPHFRTAKDFYIKTVLKNE